MYIIYIHISLIVTCSGSFVKSAVSFGLGGPSDLIKQVTEISFVATSILHFSILLGVVVKLKSLGAVHDVSCP